MAKAVVTTLSEVPEALRGEYEPHEGGFRLKIEGDDVPGFVPALKHAQMRETNIKVFQALGAKTPEEALQRAALVAGIDPAKLEKLRAIDPAEYETLKAKVEAFEKSGLKKPDDLDARLEQLRAEVRTSMVKPLQDQIAAGLEREKAAAARLAESALKDKILPLFAKAGGRPSAQAFLVDRFREAFQVVDEKVVAKDGRFGPKGEALTPDEWLAGAVKEYDFAFDPSKGGGAPGGAGGGVTKPANGNFRLPGGAELKAEGITVLS